MGKPQVTLTLAGDETQLTQAFARVGESSKRMADEVGGASKRVAEESEGGFDRAGEAADGAEGKAQGFSDTLTGVADIGAGTAEIMKGNLFEGFVTVGGGAADLAGGLASFLIPALGKLRGFSLSNAIASGRATAAMLVQKGVMVATTAASKAAAVGQWLLNAALTANPIGLVIAGLVLLGAGLVLAYKKSATFRAIVQGALAGVKVAFDVLRTAAVAVFNWFRDNVPKIGGFFAGVGGSISAPFRAAFNAIRSFWNSTIGGKGFDVPGWVPEIGGKSFRIPYFHTGGIVSGAMGAETLAVLKAGERVTGGRNGGGAATFVFKSDGSRAGKLLLQLFKETMRTDNPQAYQVVFGR